MARLLVLCLAVMAGVLPARAQERGEEAPDATQLLAPPPSAMRDEAPTPDRPDPMKVVRDSVTVTVAGEALTLPARIYAAPLRVKAIDPATTGNSTVIEAAQSDFSAWTAGADDLIVASFVAGEREQVQNYLADPDARTAAVGSYRLFETMRIWGDIVYNGDRLLLVSYEDTVDRGRVMAFRNNGFGWRRTTALADDPVIEALQRELREGRLTPDIPPQLREPEPPPPKRSGATGTVPDRERPRPDPGLPGQGVGTDYPDVNSRRP